MLDRGDMRCNRGLRAKSECRQPPRPLAVLSTAAGIMAFAAPLTATWNTRPQMVYHAVGHIRFDAGPVQRGPVIIGGHEAHPPRAVVIPKGAKNASSISFSRRSTTSG
jgi:hypothetical protein